MDIKLTGKTPNNKAAEHTKSDQIRLRETTEDERPVRTIYRGLLLKGIPEQQAANMAAVSKGLGSCSEGKCFKWKIKEVSNLLFLRHLYRRGKI